MKKYLFILIWCFALSVSAYADEKGVNLNVSIAAEEETAEVKIEYNSDFDICGGNVDLKYNTEKLSLKEYTEGDAIKQTTHFVNQKYAEDCIRLNWASLTPLEKSGHMITFVFEFSDNFKNEDVIVSSLKFIDENGQKIETQIEYSVQNANEETEEDDDEPSKGGSSGKTSSSGGRTSVSIKQENENPAELAEIDFKDVSESDWFYEDVVFACKNGLMNGVGDTLFAPDEAVTRAMLVTILYRLEGEPQADAGYTFEDIEKDVWYSDAVVWANAKGIVNGYSDVSFAPYENVTREQAAAIIYRYAGFKNYDVNIADDKCLDSYTDADKIADYAISGFQWLNEKGIIKGETDTTVNPGGVSTRAQIAAVLKRFLNVVK